MKLLWVAVLGMCTITALAAPAFGDSDDPSVNDAVFLDSLRKAGISYTSPVRAITAAETVCALYSNGILPLQIITDLKATNPGFTTDGAAQFAGIAANAYCPQDDIPTTPGTAGDAKSPGQGHKSE